MKQIKKLFSFFWDKSLLTFILIGAGNTVITVLGSQLLLGPVTNAWGRAAGYWVSTAVMFALTSIISFVLNRKLSFKSNAPLGKSIFRFSVLIAVCYLISFSLSDMIMPALLGVVMPSLSVDWVTRISMLAAQVIFTGMNYVGQRLWAFKE